MESGNRRKLGRGNGGNTKLIKKLPGMEWMSK
ncbi:MAG: hypothetical protein CM1200mP29_08130 [Verrucomicrobiota bacterium]|nr:MAG: hypothetical protein CM1200mP29_08130 [Verrucomicrobiota bacterium]